MNDSKRNIDSFARPVTSNGCANLVFYSTHLPLSPFPFPLPLPTNSHPSLPETQSPQLATRNAIPKIIKASNASSLLNTSQGAKVGELIQELVGERGGKKI